MTSEAPLPRRRPGWAVWLPLALLAALVVLAVAGLSRSEPPPIHSRLIGKPMPEFSLEPALAGVPALASADLRDGRPRLVNVFASWCVPCAIEAPQLARLAREGVEIAGIAIRDRPEDVAAFLARHGNPFRRIGADPVSGVQLGLGSAGVPETFVVDSRGIIRYQHIGEIRPEHLPLIRAQLAEAAE